MHHGDDEYRGRLISGEQTVGEAANQEASESLGESVTQRRMRSNHGYELQTETVGLGLVELPGSDKLCFSVRMKTDAFHRSVDRAFRKTASARLPFTVPERSSSRRRSASATQSFSASGSI